MIVDYKNNIVHTGYDIVTTHIRLRKIWMHSNIATRYIFPMELNEWLIDRTFTYKMNGNWKLKNIKGDCDV